MSIWERSWRVDRRTILKSTRPQLLRCNSLRRSSSRHAAKHRSGSVWSIPLRASTPRSRRRGRRRQSASEEINKKGGILGRQVELLVEDSANDVGTGVQKTRKLIDRDQVNCIIGDVNSGIALPYRG